MRTAKQPDTSHAVILDLQTGHGFSVTTILRAQKGVKCALTFSLLLGFFSRSLYIQMQHRKPNASRDV